MPHFVLTLTKTVTPRTLQLKTLPLTQARGSDFIFAASWGCHLAIASASIHMPC